MVIIVVIIIFYHRFFFPWYFSSWTNGAPHHSGFNFQIVALSILCAMSLVQLSFVHNLLNALLVLFTDTSLVLQLQFQWPQWLLVWRSVSYSTLAEFIYLDFYILVYFHSTFVLHSHSLVLLRPWISKYYQSCFNYQVWGWRSVVNVVSLLRPNDQITSKYKIRPITTRSLRAKKQEKGPIIFTLHFGITK